MKMFTKIVSILSVISLFAVAQANASVASKPVKAKVMMKKPAPIKDTKGKDDVSTNDDVNASYVPVVAAGAAIAATTVAKQGASE